jgi:hypothetical protein
MAKLTAQVGVLAVALGPQETVVRIQAGLEPPTKVMRAETRQTQQIHSLALEAAERVQ